jgi:hypothetical protein
MYEKPDVVLVLPKFSFLWAAGLSYEQPKKQVEQKLVDKLSTRIIRESCILSPSGRFHGSSNLTSGVRRLIDGSRSCSTISGKLTFVKLYPWYSFAIVLIPRNDAGLYFDNT